MRQYAPELNLWLRQGAFLLFIACFLTDDSDDVMSMNAEEARESAGNSSC